MKSRLELQNKIHGWPCSPGHTGYAASPPTLLGCPEDSPEALGLEDSEQVDLEEVKAAIGLLCWVRGVVEEAGLAAPELEQQDYHPLCRVLFL